METIAEPLTLGLSSGLLCLTACGPVVLPWLAVEGASWRGTARLLTRFLAGRLAGYLGFAVVMWALGLALPLPGRAHALVFAAAHLVLALALVTFVLSRPRPATTHALTLVPMPRQHCHGGCGARQPSAWQRALMRRSRLLAPAVFGFTTGLSPCPPFIAAGVRTAEQHSLVAALAFFALFFLGTTVWFVPFLGVASLRRVAAVAQVARFTALLVAAYYGYIGAVTIGGVLAHG